MPLPEGINFKVGSILTRRKRLIEMNMRFLAKLDDAQFINDTFDSYVNMAVSTLKIKDEDVVIALRESLMSHYGSQISNELLNRLTWKLAGGEKYIKARKVLSSTFLSLKDQKPKWTPLFIEDIDLDEDVKNGVFVRVCFIVCGGEFAGLQFVQKMPYKLMTFIFSKSIGFPKWKGVHFKELTQCIMIGLLSAGDKVVVNEVDATPSVIAWNKKLRKNRLKPCVNNFTVMCYDCVRGYEGKIMVCPRACRQWALVVRSCYNCGEEKALFRFNTNYREVCEACRLKHVRQRLKLLLS